MNRKEIIVFFLRETRNELANALEGLSHEDLVATPVTGRRNPIGWMVCHVMRTMNWAIHSVQTGESCLSKDDGHLVEYASKPPGPGNPAPDLAKLAAAADGVFARCIRLVEELDDEAFDRPAAHWTSDRSESVAGNCVRMINHNNAHLRQIWMLRGAMGKTEPWPGQTLIKVPDDPDGKFHVPEREEILARRKR